MLPESGREKFPLFGLLVLTAALVATGWAPGSADAARDASRDAASEAPRKVATKMSLNSVAENPYGPGNRDWKSWGRLRSSVPACINEPRRVSVYRAGRKIGSGEVSFKTWGADTTRVKVGQRIRVKIAYRKVTYKRKPVVCVAASKTFRIKQIDPPSSGYAATDGSSLYNAGYDFGTVTIGSGSKRLRKTLIENRGTKTVRLGEYAFKGLGSSKLSIWRDGCLEELPAGESCYVGIDLFPGEKPARIDARLSIAGVTVQGPGFRGKVIGPKLKRLRAPRRLPASGRVVLASVKCPMACKVTVAPASVSIGEMRLGVSSFGRERLPAGGKTRVGLRLNRQMSALLRDQGKGVFSFGVCATPLRATADVCLSPKRFKVRGGARASASASAEAGLGLVSSAIDFGTVIAGATTEGQTVTLTNEGSEEIPAGEVTLAGKGRDDFYIYVDGCSNSPIRPGESCSLRVRFTPEKPGRWRVQLRKQGSYPGAIPGSAITGRAVGATIKRFDVPKRRVKLGARIPMAKYSCPVVRCSATVGATLKVGGWTFGIRNFGPRRIGADKSAVVGLMVPKKYRSRIEAAGSAILRLHVQVVPRGSAYSTIKAFNLRLKLR